MLLNTKCYLQNFTIKKSNFIIIYKKKLLSLFFQNKKLYKKYIEFYKKYIGFYNNFYIKKQKDRKKDCQYFIVKLKKYQILIIILYIDKTNLIVILKIVKK